MTATAAAMVAHARTDPFGRAALALVWFGLLVGTSGIWQLQTELRRHPLAAPQTPAPFPGSETAAAGLDVPAAAVSPTA